ncbi:unnamed protein product [Bursaphelenchus xylophilus]|uniref:(pine wood nematode) hypothetical protein n=1 Tax=Bursaphelenchus xylophilus TaxID=6326 RepID=A0A1I7RR07_BURXY|nr:unnamed protein product [Bursaphelenchus xylophilus]CAG9130784.1 unnamed protein product [Bursaphelenchus xylophilus]
MSSPPPPSVDRHEFVDWRINSEVPAPMKGLIGLESPLVSAVKLALFMMVHSPSGMACVKSCSNALRGSFVSIVGQSADVDSRLLAPFHAILAKSRTNLVAQRKLAWVCHSMRKFEHCLSSCSESRAKTLQLIKVEQWYAICETSRTYPKNFGEFIGCEKRHHDEVNKFCPKLNIALTNSLDSFCRKMNDHSECYVKVGFKCKSDNATEVWKLVNNAIQRSYQKILQLSRGNVLPPECEWAMRNIALTTRMLPTSTTTESTTEFTTELTTTTEEVHEFTVDYWQDVDQSHLYVFESKMTTTLPTPTFSANHSPQNALNGGTRPQHTAFLVNLLIFLIALLH